MTIKSQGTEDAEYFQLQGMSVKEGTIPFRGKCHHFEAYCSQEKGRSTAFFHTAVQKRKRQKET